MNSKNENLAMLCDFYEFTMGNGYLKNNLHKNSKVRRRYIKRKTD